MNRGVLLILQSVSMGKRANPRTVILPKMSLTELIFTSVYKTFRWEEHTGKSSYLQWAWRTLIPPWSTKRFDCSNNDNNNNNKNNNQGLVDRGGRKRVIPTLQAWAFKDRRKGDPTASVVGKKKTHSSLPTFSPKLSRTASPRPGPWWNRL